MHSMPKPSTDPISVQIGQYQIATTMNFLAPNPPVDTGETIPMQVRLESFVNEDGADTFEHQEKILTLLLSFSSSDDGNPEVFADELPMPPEVITTNPDFGNFVVSLVRFKNFDKDVPVYTHDLVKLATPWDNDLMMLAKVQRPFQGATFRDITLTLYWKHKGDENEKV